MAKIKLLLTCLLVAVGQLSAEPFDKTEEPQVRSLDFIGDIFSHVVGSGKSGSGILGALLGKGSGAGEILKSAKDVVCGVSDLVSKGQSPFNQGVGELTNTILKTLTGSADGELQAGIKSIISGALKGLEGIHEGVRSQLCKDSSPALRIGDCSEESGSESESESEESSEEDVSPRIFGFVTDIISSLFQSIIGSGASGKGILGMIFGKGSGGKAILDSAIDLVCDLSDLASAGEGSLENGIQALTDQILRTFTGSNVGEVQDAARLLVSAGVKGLAGMHKGLRNIVCKNRHYYPLGPIEILEPRIAPLDAPEEKAVAVAGEDVSPRLFGIVTDVISGLFQNIIGSGASGKGIAGAIFGSGKAGKAILDSTLDLACDASDLAAAGEGTLENGVQELTNHILKTFTGSEIGEVQSLVKGMVSAAVKGLAGLHHGIRKFVCKGRHFYVSNLDGEVYVYRSEVGSRSGLLDGVGSVVNSVVGSGKSGNGIMGLLFGEGSLGGKILKTVKTYACTASDVLFVGENGIKAVLTNLLNKVLQTFTGATNGEIQGVIKSFVAAIIEAAKGIHHGLREELCKAPEQEQKHGGIWQLISMG